MLAKLITNTIVNFTLESCYFVEVEMTDFIDQDKSKTGNLSMGFRSYNPLDVSGNPPSVSPVPLWECSITFQIVPSIQSNWLGQADSETVLRIFCVHLCFCKVKYPHIPSS